MQDMVININDMDLPDSAKIDSFCKIVKKIRITGKEGRGPMNGRGRGRADAFRYEYDFEPPELPEPPAPPAIGDNDLFNRNQEFEPFRRNIEERGKTLSDVLGDILMDKVKSYSVKETKDGKGL